MARRRKLTPEKKEMFSNIQKDNISEIKDFSSVYDAFINYFVDNGFDAPWEEPDLDALSSELKRSAGVNDKNRALIKILFSRVFTL